ncbi:MAG TPA: YciI family protein [Pseudomonadales bacterium]|nr:YciI family protein [Pseudomonadales bacterium]
MATDAPSTAEAPSSFATWMSTYAKHLPDLGGQFGRGALVLPDGASQEAITAIEGIAGGYMIIEADDLDEAVAIARACPGLVRNGSGVEVIEVHEPG